jgi:hypothetical protein
MAIPPCALVPLRIQRMHLLHYEGCLRLDRWEIHANQCNAPPSKGGGELIDKIFSRYSLIVSVSLFCVLGLYVMENYAWGAGDAAVLLFWSEVP